MSERCSICGGQLEKQEVTKNLLGRGWATCVILEDADVCVLCGKREYSEEAKKLFDQIREEEERKRGRKAKPRIYF